MMREFCAFLFVVAFLAEPFIIIWMCRLTSQYEWALFLAIVAIAACVGHAIALMVATFESLAKDR